MTKRGQIRHDELCLTYVRYAHGSQVLMKQCDGSDNQVWSMTEGGLIRFPKRGLCLDSRDHHEAGVAVRPCNSALDSQRWLFVRGKA